MANNKKTQSQSAPKTAPVINGRQVTLTVPFDMYDRLAAQANREMRTVPNFIIFSVNRELQAQAQARGSTGEDHGGTGN